MRRTYKTEIWKAFHNSLFWISIIVGFMLNVAHIIGNYFLAQKYLYDVQPFILENGMVWGMGNMEGMSVYVNWIGADENQLESVIFWFILPLLAAMPYGGIALSERKNRYQNQILIRCGRKQGGIARYLAAFVSGGMVITLPVIFNFFTAALFMPLENPVVTSDCIMMETQFGSLLVYQYPLFFVLLVFLFVFLWGGTFGAMALAVGQWIKNRIFVICFPFAFCLLIEFIFATGVVVTSLEWSPRQLLHLVSIRGTSGFIIVGEIVVLLAFSFLLYWIKEIQYEGI